MMEGIRSKAFVATLGVAVALAIGGCATPPRPVVPKEGFIPVAQVKAPIKFNVVGLSRENFGQVARACLKYWADTGTQRTLANWKYPLARGTVIAYGHERDASYLMTEGSDSICVQQSDLRFPIIAAEALYRTANPVGVPPDVLDNWYQQVANLIARTGSAQVFYKMPNGNAQSVRYWIESSTANPTAISYWAEFKRDIAWTPTAESLVFEHPAMQSFSVTKYGNQHAKSFLNHRLN